MSLPVGDIRNVALSLVDHIRGDANLAAHHLYDSWDDAVDTMDTPQWVAPAMVLDFVDKGTPTVRAQGGPTLVKPLRFAVQFFGRHEGPGVKEQRDDYLAALAKRISCEDIAVGGRHIPIYDYASNAKTLLGYAEVQEVRVETMPAAGANPRERYRGQVIVGLRFHDRKLAYG